MEKSLIIRIVLVLALIYLFIRLSGDYKDFPRTPTAVIGFALCFPRAARRFFKSVYSGIRRLKHPAVLGGFALIGAAAAWLYLNRSHILTPLRRPTDGDITATLYVPPLDLFMGRFPAPVRYAAFWLIMLSPVVFLTVVGIISGKKENKESFKNERN